MQITKKHPKTVVIAALLCLTALLTGCHMKCRYPKEDMVVKLKVGESPTLAAVFEPDGGSLGSVTVEWYRNEEKVSSKTYKGSEITSTYQLPAFAEEDDGAVYMAHAVSEDDGKWSPKYTLQLIGRDEESTVLPSFTDGNVGATPSPSAQPSPSQTNRPVPTATVTPSPTPTPTPTPTPHVHSWEPIKEERAKEVEETIEILTYVCDVCGSNFDSREKADAHANDPHAEYAHGYQKVTEEIVNTTMKYVCGDCGYVAADDGQKQAHTADSASPAHSCTYKVVGTIFYKIPGYQCNLCSATFTDITAADIHPVDCEVLKRDESAMWEILSVELTATEDEYGYQCDVCSTVFAEQEEAGNHHSANPAVQHASYTERPEQAVTEKITFACTKCSETFEEEEKAWQHIAPWEHPPFAYTTVTEQTTVRKTVYETVDTGRMKCSGCGETRE